ncbi:MAG: hypothetical protein H6586_03710 [Flavobacteriales bacterium]|nr:hypothetical protein [Flavobacteriales bacterium]
MAKEMLEYTKDLLRKVSFDVKLFRKELAKAYQRLLDEEVEELKKWVLANFGKQYYLNPIYIAK